MNSPTPPTGHIFISYDREDQEYARELADSLRQRGFEAWMDDRMDFGDRWWQTIVQAIRDCAAFVVVMTPDAEASEWVEPEILLARREGKPIFPLLLRGQEFPLLMSVQYADVTDGRMPPDEFYERLGREVGAKPEEEVIEVAPLAPEPTVRRKRVWSWQRQRLPLVVVGLLAVLLLVGVGAFWLSGSDWRLMRASTTTEPVVAPPVTETSTVTATPLPGTDTPTPSPSALPTIHATIPQYLALPPLSASLADTWTRPADDMEMVYVAGGTFEMGNADGGDNEQPVHTVTLNNFFIDKTEVTNDQFERFVQATNYRTDAEEVGISSVNSDGKWRQVRGADWQHPNGPETSISDRMDHPVVQVSWNDATTYCQWAGGRLPTEAEWEYAARGPDGNVYPWGNDLPDYTLLNFYRNVDDTTRVGAYPDGSSWVDAMDMAGNVWEWVADWYGEYSSEAQTNPKGPETGVWKVMRGGSWITEEISVRATRRRDRYDPGDRFNTLGFRCVVGLGIGSTIVREKDGMEMVYVPGGTFEMGSTDAEIDAAFERCEQDRGSGECERSWFEDESPRHSVTLDSFWIDETEVTNARYSRCVAEGRCSLADHRTNNVAEYPVVSVFWGDAADYCEWVGGRLPTEAEWEYAARGPDGSIYPWGDTYDGSKTNASGRQDGYQWTSPVGSFPAGASWAGALDMAGNVGEWVNDLYDGYPGTTYQSVSFGRAKVLRGGDWSDDETDVRAALRRESGSGHTTNSNGFRCVVASTSLPTPEATEAAFTPTATSVPPTDTPVPPTDKPVPGSSIPPSNASLHDTWTRPTDGMEMVYVPGGTFEMGSTGGEDDEQPVHAVALDSFWIDRTEVTNSQYARCEADGTCRGPTYKSSHTRDSYYGNSKFDDYPVIWVDWHGADTYCQWAGGRLPTEAEWEYAARGPDGHAYPWGNDRPDDTLLNYSQNVGDTIQVGSYPDGASWVGAMDMAGNVWEWVSDWYAEYAASPAENPTGPDTGDKKVLRGGSLDYDPNLTRSAFRSRNFPDRHHVIIGFRCVFASTSSP